MKNGLAKIKEPDFFPLPFPGGTDRETISYYNDIPQSGDVNKSCSRLCEVVCSVGKLHFNESLIYYRIFLRRGQALEP